MKVAKLNRTLATANFVLGMVGYTFIASIGSMYLTDSSQSQMLTVPYRAVALGISIMVILLNLNNGIRKDTLLKMLTLYWFILLGRMVFDFYIDSPVRISPESKSYTMLYMLGIVIPSTMACSLSCCYINFKAAFYWCLALLSLSAVCSFISNEALTAIREASHSRVEGVMLNAIAFGYSGVYLAVLCMCRNTLGKMTSLQRIVMLVGIAIGIFIMLRAGSRGPLLAFILSVTAYQILKNGGGILGMLSSEFQLFTWLICAKIYCLNGSVPCRLLCKNEYLQQLRLATRRDAM